MKEFSNRVMSALADDEHDESIYERIHDKMCSTSRWSSFHYMVFKEISTGTLYEGHYSRGLTEQQDESPYEDEGEMIKCREVEAYEKTVTNYRLVEGENE